MKSSIILALAEWLCYSFNLYVNKLIAGVDTKGLTKNKEQEKLWQITCQVSCVARKNWNNARVTLEGLQQGSSIYPVRFWSTFSLNPAISMACLASRIPLTLSPAQSRMSLSLYFKILWIPGFGGGGGGTWVNFCPYPILVYSVTNYRPHLSHFFGQICDFCDPNLVAFYFNELTHFLNWMKNTLIFTFSTNILVRLLTLNQWGTVLPQKIRKCATPF